MGVFLYTMADNPFEVTRKTPGFNIAQQEADANAYLDKYTSAIGSLAPTADIYSGYAEKLGVPALQEKSNKYSQLTDSLTASLDALPDQIAGRSQESMLTQGQKERMVTAESQPILDNLSKLGVASSRVGQQLSQAQTNAAQMTGYDVADQERTLLPFEKGFDMLEQRQAREFSGYTFQEQQELNRLLENAQLGFQWTNAEKNRAHELSLKEMEYKEALKYMREEYQQRTVSQGYINNL